MIIVDAKTGLVITPKEMTENQILITLKVVRKNSRDHVNEEELVRACSVYREAERRGLV